jgi:molybdopterin-guanine dinucleotide biosynthesis protein A
VTRSQSEAVPNRANRPIAGYILAGGGSTRFGQDKALVEFQGVPMLVLMHRLLGAVLGDSTVIASPGKYAGVGLDTVGDCWPGEGPLGGIITALTHTARTRQPAAWNLIIGCDMPFLTEDWIAYMAERACASRAEVLVPRSSSGLEPLCVCWKTSAAPKLRLAFEEGTRKISDAMQNLSMEILDESAWKRFDNTGRLFWNMNTPADYEQARRVMKAGQL